MCRISSREAGQSQKTSRTRRRKKRKLVGHVIRLVIILLIAFGIFLIFVDPPKPDDIVTSGKAYDSFKDKMKALEKNKKGSKEFSEEEVNSFITQMVIDMNKDGNVRLSQIFVELLDDNKVKVFLDVDLFNLRIVASCEGTISGSDKGLVFKPSGFFSSKLGRLPYPMPLFKRMTAQVLKDEDIQDFLAIIESAEVSNGTVTVEVGE